MIEALVAEIGAQAKATFSIVLMAHPGILAYIQTHTKKVLAPKSKTLNT